MGNFGLANFGRHLPSGCGSRCSSRIGEAGSEKLRARLITIALALSFWSSSISPRTASASLGSGARHSEAIRQLLRQALAIAKAIEFRHCGPWDKEVSIPNRAAVVLHIILS